MDPRLSRSRPYGLPSCRDGGRCDAGFTLIEILVAMTLLGLVVAVLAGGLRLGVRAWEAESERAEELSETQAVQAFLRSLVQQAYPYHEGKETDVAFEGRPGAMSFVAPLPSHVGFGGLHRVRLDVETGGRGEQQLVFRHVLLHPDVDPGAPNEQVRGETVLLTGLEGLRISYYGSDSLRSPRTWRSEWARRERLPDLVRIDLSLTNSGSRLWPSLILSPMLSLETLCVREPNESRCRRILVGE